VNRHQTDEQTRRRGGERNAIHACRILERNIEIAVRTLHDVPNAAVLREHNFLVGHLVALNFETPQLLPSLRPPTNKEVFCQPRYLSPV
jgi:hypothetical protein